MTDDEKSTTDYEPERARWSGPWRLTRPHRWWCCDGHDQPPRPLWQRPYVSVDGYRFVVQLYWGPAPGVCRRQVVAGVDALYAPLVAS